MHEERQYQLAELKRYGIELPDRGDRIPASALTTLSELKAAEAEMNSNSFFPSLPTNGLQASQPATTTHTTPFLPPIPSSPLTYTYHSNSPRKFPPLQQSQHKNKININSSFSGLPTVATAYPNTLHLPLTIPIYNYRYPPVPDGHPSKGFSMPCQSQVSAPSYGRLSYTKF